MKAHIKDYLLNLPKLAAGPGSKALSRTQAIAGELLASPRRAGWAYAYKSPVWHEVTSTGRTSCGRIFNSHKATWCQAGGLPLEVERCQKCEARRARREAAAAEQARIEHETRDQLTFAF